jgi:hypothetical protein
MKGHVFNFVQMLYAVFGKDEFYNSLYTAIIIPRSFWHKRSHVSTQAACATFTAPQIAKTQKPNLT